MKKYHGTAMVQPWYTTVNSGISWYHVTVPWYIVVLPWYIANVPWYIVVLPWCMHGTKELVPWYIMVYHGTLYLYHSTSICNHMEQFTCMMVYYGIPLYIFIPPWYKYLIPWYATVYHSITLCYYGTPMVQITYTLANTYVLGIIDGTYVGMCEDTGTI